jgi:hypothetical protein
MIKQEIVDAVLLLGEYIGQLEKYEKYFSTKMSLIAIVDILIKDLFVSEFLQKCPKHLVGCLHAYNKILYFVKHN